MKEKTTQLLLSIITSITAILILIWWMASDPTANFAVFNPGMDNRPGISSSESGIINIGGFFLQFNGHSTNTNGHWPRFRGEDFDNISKETIPLASSWQNIAPPRIWSIELGEGHSGPVISRGRVFIMDYDEVHRRDLLRCFSFEDGKEIWQRGYDIFIKRNHGFSRTVPAVWNEYVVTIGPKCHVMCVDADSGTFKWGLDIARTYNSEIPLWYTGQCPLIDEGTVVLAIGGSALMIGVDCATGEVIWETPNPSNLKMSHASIMPMTIYGHKMYVYSALGGLVGVSAEEGTKGEIQFESREWNHAVVAPSAIYAGSGYIFATAGYGAGSMLFQVTLEQEVFTIKAIQKNAPDEGLASEQQTPIYFNNHLLAIVPKDAGSLRNQLVCCPADDPGKIIWSSGKTNRFGLGPYMLADNKFFLLSDDGVLTIAEASTKQYRQLAQVKILEGHDAWGPMALVKGRLLARDSRNLVCLDIRQNR